MATMTKVLPRQYELFLPSRPVYHGRYTRVKSLMDEITGAIIPIKGVTMMPVLTRDGRKKVMKDLNAQLRHFNRRLNWLLRKHNFMAKGYFIGDVFTVHACAKDDAQAERVCMALKDMGIYGGIENVEVVVMTEDRNRMYRVTSPAFGTLSLNKEREEHISGSSPQLRRGGGEVFDGIEAYGQMQLF